MGKIMRKFLKSSIISSIALAILGVLLFFQSELTLISISYIIGGILVAIGVLGILKYIGKSEKNELDIVYGIVTVILGIIIISNPKAIGSIIPFIIGFVIVINSALKLQYGFELKKAKNNLWKSTIILSIVTVIVGVLLIFNPFKGAEIITKIVGALIFTYSIIDIITTLTIRGTIKEIYKEIEDSISEAEVVEEKAVDKKSEKNSKEEEK